MTESDLSLAAYFNAVLRRWYLVALALAVCVGVAVVNTARQDELYRSTASVLVTQARGVEVVDVASQGGNIFRNLENEAEFARSRRVVEEVVARLEQVPSVAVVASRNADVLFFQSVSASATAASDAANAYAQVFIDERRQRVVDEYGATAETVQTSMNVLDDRLALLGAEDPDRVPLARQREALLLALQELSLAGQLSGGESAEIVQEAFPAESPFQPEPRRDLLLGIIAGLGIGVGGALLIEFLDDKVRSVHDLEAVDPRLVSLATVPTARNESDSLQIVTVEDPDGAAAEAYRALRAAVSFLAASPDLTAIQVTSAAKGEGKSTTVANVAVAYARTGKRVVVVDGDLRRPQLHAFFSTSASPGLADVLVGHYVAEDVASRPLFDSRLVFLAAGRLLRTRANCWGARALKCSSSN